VILDLMPHIGSNENEKIILCNKLIQIEPLIRKIAQNNDLFSNRNGIYTNNELFVLTHK
jgi:hypothetical protein